MLFGFMVFGIIIIVQKINARSSTDLAGKNKKNSVCDKSDSTRTGRHC